MVQFDARWSQADNRKTLHEVVRSGLERIAEPLSAKSIEVDLDLDDTVMGMRCTSQFERLVAQLMELAVSRNPEKGELTITACRTTRGLEVEVADSGPQPATSKIHAFAQQDCGFVAGIDPTRLATGEAMHPNLSVYCSRCPQGGLAWTAVMESRRVNVRAA